LLRGVTGSGPWPFAEQDYSYSKQEETAMLVMPDEHAARLRTLLKLQDGVEIPEPIADVYWKYKRLADRQGECLTAADLRNIVVTWSIITPNAKLPEDPRTFANVVEEGGVEYDSPVEAKFRGEYVSGRYKGVRSNGGRISAIIVEMDGEERNIKPAHVQLPKA
jgi:hypothetical protein